MKFTEWYESEYKEEWDEDNPPVTVYAITIEYEEFCSRNKITPVWNG